jgi:hypothetical protein
MNQVPPPTSQSRNIIARLWHGELGLPVTYWVFGVGGRFAWAILIEIVGYSNKVGALLLFVLMLAYSIVVYIGIWRAADKYTGRSEWALLSKCVVVIGFIFLIRNIELLLGL